MYTTGGNITQANSGITLGNVSSNPNGVNYNNYFITPSNDALIPDKFTFASASAFVPGQITMEYVKATATAGSEIRNIYGKEMADFGPITLTFTT